jgi:glycosyltransferase involved in cell wall biosynthesis
MICLLHGYLLDGSGSNLWTRSVLRALCRDGVDVQLICQEADAAAYDFIAEAYTHHPDGTVEAVLWRDTPYPGRCVMHRPLLGDTLPVYVWDQYDDFEHVVPMTELDEATLEEYLRRNVDVIVRVIHDHGVSVMHVNHAVLMAVAAQRASAWTGVPYVVMPHGSALEYAVRPDSRFRRLGADAFAHASRILVISDEVARRVDELLDDGTADLPAKLVRLDLGVDTAAFRPVEPAGRRQNIEQLKRLLADVPRGRSAAQGAAFAAAHAAGGDAAGAANAVGEYTAKLPDEDVEAKLDSVDWETDRVLVFVGRLIAAKGIHAVIAALPLILARVPRMRLLVVGHGPLREPLELLVRALAAADRVAAEHALACAESMDAGEPEHLAALPAFWRSLEQQHRTDEYWAAAARHMQPDTVVFTGYLAHREMSLLLPCCDAAVFPSMVVESGPLVFLEALASGVLPIGTYFGGMKVKIDRVAAALPPGGAAALRVRPDAAVIAGDLVDTVPPALELSGHYRTVLRAVAVAEYDWRPVAQRLEAVLSDVSAGAGTRAG